MAARTSVQSSLRALADGISVALKQNDIPRAMHLSWVLMMQPQCPLQLQSHAVLVHSVASLSLGGDTEIIESNVRATHVIQTTVLLTRSLFLVSSSRR